MAKHKTLGQVYTEPWIVSEILDLVGYHGEHILDKYILEPACGDGAFLKEIIARYIEVCKNKQIPPPEIKQRLEKYIYGVELDPAEHQKALYTLDALVVSKLSITAPVQWKIYHQNTLDFYKNHLSFFDFVVGNPPYIRIHNLEHPTREILKNDFLFSEGTIDIYLSFFEMGFKMLHHDGHLGYITPNSYLHNSSYKLFRAYLQSQRIVKTLIDFKAHKVFKGFSTYTAITVIQKNRQENFFEYKELINGQIQWLNNISFDTLTQNDWSFTDVANEHFLAQLNHDKTHSVKDFFDVQYGFATLRDRIFIAKTTDYSDDLVYFNGSLVEKHLLKTVVKGSRFRGVIDETEKILFPYQQLSHKYTVIPEWQMQQQYPLAYQYLWQHKAELEQRDVDKGALWYEFGRSQGIQTMHNEKIVLSTLVNGKIEFYKVPKEVLMYSGLFIIKNKPDANWKMIEDILSSEEFYQYIRLTGKDFSGGYKSITSKQIKEFRVRP